MFISVSALPLFNINVLEAYDNEQRERNESPHQKIILIR